MEIVIFAIILTLCGAGLWLFKYWQIFARWVERGE